MQECCVCFVVNFTGVLVSETGSPCFLRFTEEPFGALITPEEEHDMPSLRRLVATADVPVVLSNMDAMQVKLYVELAREVGRPYRITSP